MIYESLHIQMNHDTINFKTDTCNINNIYNNVIQQPERNNSNRQKIVT